MPVSSVLGSACLTVGSDETVCSWAGEVRCARIRVFLDLAESGDSLEREFVIQNGHW